MSCMDISVRLQLSPAAAAVHGPEAGCGMSPLSPDNTIRQLPELLHSNAAQPRLDYITYGCNINEAGDRYVCHDLSHSGLGNRKKKISVRDASKEKPSLHLYKIS